MSVVTVNSLQFHSRLGCSSVRHLTLENFIFLAAFLKKGPVVLSPTQTHTVLSVCLIICWDVLSSLLLLPPSPPSFSSLLLPVSHIYNVHHAHMNTERARLFSLWKAVWLRASSHYRRYLYTHCPPPAPSSVTCTHSTPSLPTHTHTHTHTHTPPHHSCRAFTRLLKTGSVAGNMLVTYVVRLLSLSEKLFVCGWAQAYVSPMTIRSGPSQGEGGLPSAEEEEE